MAQSLSNLGVLLSPKQQAAAQPDKLTDKPKTRRRRSKSDDSDTIDARSTRSSRSGASSRRLKTKSRSRSRSSDRKMEEAAQGALDAKKEKTRRSRSKSSDRDIPKEIEKSSRKGKRTSSQKARSRSRSADKDILSVGSQDKPSLTPTSQRQRRAGRRGSASSGQGEKEAKALPFGNDSFAGSLASNGEDVYMNLNDGGLASPAASDGSSRRRARESRRNINSTRARSSSASRRKSSSIKKKCRSENNVLQGMSPTALASLKRSAEVKKKSRSDGNVLSEISPMRLLHQRQLSASQHRAAQQGLPEIPSTDDDSVTDPAFDDAWNEEKEPPEHDIESLLQAVLKSKVLEPRARQDSKRKAEIERIRGYLNEVSTLCDSLETERTKQLAEEQENLFVKLQEQTEIIVEYRTQISYLEEECEARKKQSEELQEQLDQSHEHVEALLAEVEELESHVLDTEEGKNGENGPGVSLKELRDAKARVKQLEEELHNAQTVPQLQIDELDAENKTLQGRLKAEKLDYNVKINMKDEAIEELTRKLDVYENAGDAQDMGDARQKLQEARDDASGVRKNLEKVNQTLEEMKVEMDRVLTKNADLAESNQQMKDSNKALNAKVEELNKDILEWMDKAYNWKDKADTAARKVEDLGGKDTDTMSISSGGMAAALANQGMFLAAAMEKTVGSAAEKRKSWNPFVKKQAHPKPGEEDGGDESANATVIRSLQDQKDQLEDTVSLLQAENDTIEEEHKNEMAEMMVKLARLESENAALRERHGVELTSVSTDEN
ncbi:MAG: hypothetical protein SGARI_000359, partial [Bacillariaceae sp.]